MRLSPVLEQHRLKFGPYASVDGDLSGAFALHGPCGRALIVISSCGDEEIRWEHVSVSAKKYCPNWQEMCFVKDLFFDEEEPVMQLHPARSNYVNTHDSCLHLWRPLDVEIPLPPTIAV